MFDPKNSHRPTVLLAMGWFVHEINLGVARYARSAGWILEDVASHSGVLDPDWSGDGIITLVEDIRSPLVGFLERAKVPVVNLTGHFPELPYPRVLQDNHAIGRTAADELIGRGFKNLAFFTIDRDVPVVAERMAGFREAALAAGCTYHLIDYTPEKSKTKERQSMRKWLAGKLLDLPKPLGTMAQFDAEANIIVQACLLVELQVPEDVAVVGVDNDPIYSELGPIPLTSVNSNREMLGYRGAELLDQLMRGDTYPERAVRVPSGGITVRQSTNIFATTDVALSKALRFIKENATKTICVDDVAKASGISRRALYQKFDRQVGRSINVEIIRQRLNLAKDLLVSSDMKLDALAYECGFQGATSLSNAFRCHLGVGPSAYREKARAKS
jgi:LacI family transcriptional regulator